VGAVTGVIERGLGLAGLALALAALLLAGPATAAKKKGKKKGGGTVNITKVVNLPVPDRTPGPFGIDGLLNSTIDVGKRFKGLQIRDVNVTVQTLGVTGTNPAGQIQTRLVAPNGANAFLFGFLDSDGPTLSVGPLTLDDEAPLDQGDGLPTNPTRLYFPWQGSAAPDGQLWLMDGGPVRGTWTLEVYDRSVDQTSQLVSWTLNVVAGRPFQTK
jgi:Proprotein convertase P-domain